MSDKNTPEKTLSEREWDQLQYGRALKYCSDNGFRVSRFDTKKSRVMAPYIALWSVSLMDSADYLWVLTGDLPADHVSAKVAGNARDALRHFSLSWQMKAQKLAEELAAGRVTLGSPEKQQQYAGLLVHRAQGMYQIYSDDTLWANA